MKFKVTEVEMNVQELKSNRGFADAIVEAFRCGFGNFGMIEEESEDVEDEA